MNNMQSSDSLSKFMNYKAVLFDFDGVLGRTMEDNYNAWAYALNTVGISIYKNGYFLLEGFSAKNVTKNAFRSIGWQIDWFGCKT